MMKEVYTEMKKSSNFKYFVAEGVKSYSINGLMSVASTVIVTASLIVFGLYLLFSMNINHIAKQLEEECEIQVWIDEEVDVESTQLQDMENAIKSIDNVNTTEFFSNVQALEDYKQKLGKDSEYLDGLEGDNPLRNSFKVTLYDLSLAEQTSQEIEKVDGVANLSDNRSSMNKLVTVTNVIKTISFWLMLFLSAIAVFIISNAIKITLFARRRDINIMKYLGATDAFISWPFIVEGIVIGLVGAVLALTLVSLGYMVFLSKNFTIFGTLEFCKLSQVIFPMLGWFALIGVILGAVGSAVSIRRHLKV